METTLKARLTLFPGTQHHNNFRNRQDMSHLALRTLDNGRIVAAVVGCDGCSQGTTSEVGAGLVAYFAAEKLLQIIENIPLIDSDAARNIQDLLYQEILTYLRSLIALQPGGPQYLAYLDTEEEAEALEIEQDAALYSVYCWLQENLLFTVVGAYIGEQGVMIFQRGDGGYAVDELVHTEDHHNLPPYLAYHFFPKYKLHEAELRLQARNLAPVLPAPGFTGDYFPGAKRVAIFSDGMPVNNIPEIWALADPLDQWDFRRNCLAKAARRWFREGELADDLFLAVFTREDEG